MKKFLTAILGAAVISVSALGFTACGGNNKSEGISVYMPDGAPALAMASLMSVEADFGKDVNYHVVDATEIGSHVTYTDMYKNADLCVLPVNDASTLIGDGTKYKMLGTVTHGNLYIVSATEKIDLTRENFAEEISGKRLGVVQMAKFPGAAVKLILNDYEVTESVTLQPITPAEVTGVNPSCDYFVIPEPAATTRVSNANLNLKFAGASLQDLYGDGNGYPQAVIVAKTSLIKSDPEFIAQFTKSLEWSAEWLKSDSVTGNDIFNAVKAHYADPENTTPAFTAEQLTTEVIAHCAVNFKPSKDCKTEVQTFLSKLKAVNPDFASEVTDGFFYIV